MDFVHPQYLIGLTMKGDQQVHAGSTVGSCAPKYRGAGKNHLKRPHERNRRGIQPFGKSQWRRGGMADGRCTNASDPPPSKIHSRGLLGDLNWKDQEMGFPGIEPISSPMEPSKIYFLPTNTSETNNRRNTTNLWWIYENLHHLRKSGMMIPCKYTKKQ